MALPEPVPGIDSGESVRGTVPDGTRDHCQPTFAGWVILLVGVLSVVGVVILALVDRTEAATAIGSTAVPLCTVGGSLLVQRR